MISELLLHSAASVSGSCAAREGKAWGAGARLTLARHSCITKADLPLQSAKSVWVCLFFFFFLAEVLFFCEVLKGIQFTSKQAQIHPSGVRVGWVVVGFFFLSDICFSSICSPDMLFARLWVLNTGRQHLIVVFLRVLKHIKCTQAWGQCPGSVSFLPWRKPVQVVPPESLSQGCIPEIPKLCLKEGRNVAQMLFITPVFQQHKRSHPTSAALLKGSRPCLQGRSRRGNWALLHLTISLDLMGCSPFKSNSGHSLPVFPRDLSLFWKWNIKGKVWKILWVLFWGSLVRNPHFQAGKTPVSKN